jgi:hypothetical protein
MAGRIIRVALWVGVLTLLPGCVELTQTITLNPDGRGKVRIEVVTAAFDFELGPMDQKKKPKSLDEIKQEAVTKFLKETSGATAFKDVTVNWTREGKLRIVGTIYFDRLEDLDKTDAGPQDPTKTQPATTFRSSFKVTIDKGTMRIVGKNKGVDDGVKPLDNPDGPVDITKMTDKQLDEYMLRQRVEYQKARPLLEMMFNELKIKTVLLLPGDIAEVKGCQKDDNRTASQTFEGAAFLALFRKFVMMDNATVKKLVAGKNEKDLMALLGPMATMGEPDITVRNLGKAQFDYDKEVRDARAAYPALRKELGLDAGTKLPGE